MHKFIHDFLPCQEFYRKDGRLYGANPHEAFAGNPYKTASLGCYPKVILKALHRMKNANYSGTENLHFKDVSDSDVDTLLTQYIVHNIPVIFWVTIDMKQPYEGMKYSLEDGKIVSYPKDIVTQRYVELGKYALVITPTFQTNQKP